jgi:hypothetical protein
VIYLIGAEHKIQSISVGGHETADQTKFRLCLEQSIEKYKPDVVAEEYSDDALARASLRAPQEFFTRLIARAKGVEHLLCDTSLRTKCSMGGQGTEGWRMQIPRLEKRDRPTDDEFLPEALEVTRDFPLRENYGLERLRGVLQKEVIFVCGDYHVDIFGSRLLNSGIQSLVVARQIGMPTHLIESMVGVRNYFRQNAKQIEDVYQKLLKLNSGKIRSPFCTDEEEVATSN